MDKDITSLTSHWGLRIATHDDMPECLKLFERAFGATMPPALWKWKYHRDTADNIVSVDHDNIVAFYGGIPRNISVFGHDVECIQISDTMVDPLKRGILSKNGVFISAAHLFYDTVCGKEKRFALAYGFPTPRHEKLGDKIGIYSKTDVMNELSWEAKSNGSLFSTLREMKELPLSSINTLWQVMKPSFKACAIGCRDVSYMEHRYVKHPTNRYAYIGLCSRFSSQLKAIAVVKEHPESKRLEVLDLIGDVHAFDDLMKKLSHYAYKMNLPTLFMWCTPSLEPFLPQPLSKNLVCTVSIEKQHSIFDIDSLAHKWLFMGGDTDFR